jgi:biopolymer transport protein ExbD
MHPHRRAQRRIGLVARIRRSAWPHTLRNHPNAIAQINITPLVDVMLVLLVIFMLSAPVLTKPLALNLPSSKPTEAEPPPRMLLRITPAGEFVLDGRTHSQATLPAALSELADQRDDIVLEIAAAGDGDYQSFATALSAAQSSGLHHIALQPKRVNRASTTDG